MSLLILRNLSLAFGIAPLLQEANLTIEPRQRICVIGRNGAGKSTLLKVINGETLPDKGEVVHSPELRVAKLVQDIPRDLVGSIYDVVASGLGEKGELLKQYHTLNEQITEDYDEKLFNKIHVLQQALDACDGWTMQQQVDSVLSKMALNGDTLVDTLSGGMIRRVLLAKALVAEPDILLLDEPTNHLDITTIEWLEEFLLGYKKTIVFITHDRSLLKKLATQIVEVDHGKLQTWDCDYTQYLERKAAQLVAEEKANQLFDKRLAEEERWIRKGIQARRTRNEGRVRRLQAMRSERQQRNDRIGTVNLQKQTINYSGKLVFDIENLTYRCDDKTIIDDFSMKMLRGDKIGIIGANGCGKSTFLRLLLEELQPTSGTITRGTLLEVSYFDQKRAQLDEEKTVIDNISDASDFVTINGKQQHLMSYLGDFLFTPERARTPVKALSGGERHRLLLARIFTKPCNLLILDEPTNDLDAETLELLEERLVDYEGTLLLVSHDREFINNIVTSTLVFSGNGNLTEYVGNYDDYIRQRPTVVNTTKTKKNAIPEKTKSNTDKLSYKDKLALEQLPIKIEQLETDIKNLHTKISDPEFYKNTADIITQTNQQLAVLEKELAQTYEKWEALED